MKITQILLRNVGVPGLTFVNALGILGDKPPDQAKENAGILALQAQETMVDHCVSNMRNIVQRLRNLT